MRYAIGCEFTPKPNASEKDKHFVGLYGVFGKYGLGAVLTEQNFQFYLDKNNSFIIPVFTTPEEAELYAQILSRSFRRDDCWVKKGEKSRIVRRFYPIKVDSSKFSYEIKETEKRVNIEKNRFNEKTKEPVGNFIYYEVVARKS